MTATAALPCPKCRRELSAADWYADRTGGSCPACRTRFDFEAFPALDHRPVASRPQAVLVAEHATCFFHAENQAEAVCEGCGRMLCAVCAVPYHGRKLCPNCIALAQAKPATTTKPRLLYGGVALSAAILPLLFWPLTLISAPVALGFVIVGWRKPGSIVARTRARLIIAGIVALLEIIGWFTLLIFIILRRH